jgi:imidazolonepropionase
MRLSGATYLDIMVAGGGIMSTVRAVRGASDEELLEQSRARADDMLAQGTTTAEVKTGYGLTTADEMKCLRVIQHLDRTHPMDLIPTFLGAHAVPEEYRGRADDYTELVIQEMLPAVAAQRGLACFCDVFCDEGAFTLKQARKVLVAAEALGLGLKIHADEFAALGAAKMAAEMGAVSADHLIRTPREEMGSLADSGTVAVLLPGTPFGLGEREFARAQDWLEAGVAVALATDLNPGTCYCGSMPFIIALGCRNMGLTPAQAVVAATLNAAYAIGQESRVGSLEPGKVADLIVLNTDDYRDLAYRFGGNLVATVIKAGKVVVGA